MKTGTTLLRWLTVAAGLMTASNIGSAASQVIYTDSWKDTGTNESASTTGSFSINLSVPVEGVDLSEIDSNSQFFLYINSVEIASNTLGSAENYSAGNASATFPITEQDSAGNEITNGSVTVNWTATTITVSGSATNDLLDEGANFAYNGQNFSAKSTRFSFEYYEVFLTLDASDNGGGTFNYDNPYVQVIGHNSGTNQKLPDDSGTNYLETGSEEGIITPQELAISSPALNSKVYDADPVVNLAGNASDSLGVANIQCYVNGDTTNPISIDQSYEFPTNDVSWTAEVDLSQFGHVGSNVISVIAQDAGGNQTVVSRTFLWIETNTAVVMVNPTGAGTVKGIKNGQVLQVNSGYVVTGILANKNWIFSEWTDVSGDVLSSNATFEYFDLNGTWTNSSPPTLAANFVSNPFNSSGLAGTYTGLFYGCLYYPSGNPADPLDSGYTNLKVTDAGTYSGKLYLAASATPFTLSGQLSESPDGSMAVAESLIKVGKSELLDVNLMIGTGGGNIGAGIMQGYVNALYYTNQIDYAGIQGELSIFGKSVVAGHYNVYITPASTDPAMGPGGYSYGSATVSKNGAVGLALHLADGSSPAISFSSSIAQDGTCPIYASLYGGKGVILGWIEFPTGDPNFIPQATIIWLKQPVKDKYYTNGFASSPTIAAAPYLPQKAGTNNLAWPGEIFVIDQGYFGLSLPDETDVPITFNSVKSALTFDNNSNQIAITLTPTTGLLKGSFVDPAGGKTSFKYQGVDIQGGGFGFYLSTNEETGPISIGVPLSAAQFPGGDAGITITHVSGEYPLPPPFFTPTPVATSSPPSTPQE